MKHDVAVGRNCRSGITAARQLLRRALARVGDEITGEAAYLALRQPGAHEHPCFGVLALVDRRPERVELGELRPLFVREQQPDVLVAVGEAVRDPRAIAWITTTW